jgi:hypothetical protein
MSRLVRAACLVTCLFLMPQVGLAKEPKPTTPAPGAQAAPAPGGTTPAGCVRPRDLMSQEEMAAHRAKMRSFKTAEERQAYRQQWRSELQVRATKRGETLCPGPSNGGGGSGRGMGRGRMGPGGPPPGGTATPPAGQSAPPAQTPPPTLPQQ